MRALALCMILLVSFAASGATEERNTFFATDLGFSMKVPIDESYRESSYQVATFFLPASDGFAPNAAGTSASSVINATPAHPKCFVLVMAYVL